MLFKNDVAFQQIEGDQFENSLITHIRYNYRFHKRIKWEIFLQGQNNKVTLIDFRGLIGTGPRFKLSTSDNYRFYLGTLVMYEYEDQTIAFAFVPVWICQGIIPFGFAVMGVRFLFQSVLAVYESV